MERMRFDLVTTDADYKYLGTNKRGDKMTQEFYDVKLRKKVTVKITEKVTYGQGNRLRYAFRAKTDDGRNLTRFASKADWDAAVI